MLLATQLDPTVAIKLAFDMLLSMFVFFFIWDVRVNIKTHKLLKSNPPRAEQEAKALEIAHELEDAMHECGQVPLYDPAYLDPALQMYTVGRVSRVQLHTAIIEWLKHGTDYRVEENKFWQKR